MAMWYSEEFRNGYKLSGWRDPNRYRIVIFADHKVVKKMWSKDFDSVNKRAKAWVDKQPTRVWGCPLPPDSLIWPVKRIEEWENSRG